MVASLERKRESERVGLGLEWPRPAGIRAVRPDAAPRPSPAEKPGTAMCVGCGSQIHDQFILRVSPDLEWHAACLKCAECSQYLDETCTCFVRDGKTYCKRDYVRLFGIKCAKCQVGFSSSDLVMRARDSVYHIECFRCSVCSRQLLPGDEFSLREHELLCRADHGLLLERAAAGSPRSPSPLPGSRGLHLPDAGSGRQPALRPHVHKQTEKTTRVRTVLNEKQLHTLRTCYAANPRPDALMKEQLVEMTGLSPRVIRVWFQNKRCKDKKKSILMKQLQQQQHSDKTVSGRGAEGSSWVGPALPPRYLCALLWASPGRSRENWALQMVYVCTFRARLPLDLGLPILSGIGVSPCPRCSPALRVPGAGGARGGMAVRSARQSGWWVVSLCPQLQKGGSAGLAFPHRVVGSQHRG
uniref:Insulin gene enhancer protein ISL-2 n=1 Tax=Macaca fascicularis TaxID=9541 RepID=A0A7N9CRE6_MACFA